MADDSAFIERFELKYLIDEQTAGRIRRHALTFCKPDSHNPESPEIGYRVKTLYLDTPTFAFHRAKMRNDPDRFKLRIRCYDDVGPARFEIKRKVIDVIHKRRVVVQRDQVQAAAEGFLPQTVDRQRRSSETLSRFSRLVGRTGAEPVTLVRYQREAYVSEIDDYGRVTFDRRLEYQRTFNWDLIGQADAWIPLDGYWQYDGMHSPVILELKCEVRVPIWISDIIRAFGLRRRGFSKYSHGVLAYLRELQGFGLHRRQAGTNYV